MESWEGRRSCSGCFLTFSPPPSRRIHPFIHPFRHPSISWRQRRSGLESSNLDYLKKKRWLRGGPSCSVAGALGGDEAQTFFGLHRYTEVRSASGARHLFPFHTQTRTHRHAHTHTYRMTFGYAIFLWFSDEHSLTHSICLSLWLVYSHEKY